MFVVDGGQFLENCALEFSKISCACYHHPYESPPETNWKMDTWFSRYEKNKFMFYVILFHVVKHSIPVVFQDNKETELEKLENDEWIVEIDEGDGLAWTWNF